MQNIDIGIIILRGYVLFLIINTGVNLMVECKFYNTFYFVFLLVSYVRLFYVVDNEKEEYDD